MKNIKMITPVILVILLSLSMVCAQEKDNKPEKQKPGEATIKHLITELNTIYNDEQTPISERDRLMEKYGAESEEAQVHQKIYKKNRGI